VTLGIAYHMPFWRAADGTLWEEEGSFARYVDSLAPYFDRIILCVPTYARPQAHGSRVHAANVSLAPLPYFPGPRQFYPMVWRARRVIRDWVAQCDVVNLRVPTPAGIFAFREAVTRRKPVFLLVVGDYRALLPHLPYRGVKRVLFAAYVAFEEWALAHMTSRALTFANGAALRAKHEGHGARVIETKTTTLSLHDIGSRPDTCQHRPVRLLTVSRIDPRKGLRVLPSMLAQLVGRRCDVTLDIIGPPIGQLGEAEATAIAGEAERAGVSDRLRLVGALPLDQLLPMYGSYDVFVLPTRPGEGIPRVLLEAMANGLPVVTTDVAGIGSLVRHRENGVLAGGTADETAAAVYDVITDDTLRQAIIAAGYETARQHTLERQAAVMMASVSRELGIPLASEPRCA
jgi:glycosyltransferase involved in cell wall biosynthesis